MATYSTVLAIIRASHPTLRSPHERIAFAINATMLASGYRLTATGESVESESYNDSFDASVDGWNSRSDSYCFRYVKDDNINNKVILKCIVIGESLLIDASPLSSETVFNAEIKVNEFANDVSETASYAEQFKNLENLIKLINSKIILMLNKMNNNNDNNLKQSDSNANRSEPSIFNRERMYTPQTGDYIVPPRIMNVGDEDLIPAGIPGFAPQRPGVSPGGGMLLGPDDPRWGVGRPELEIPHGLPPGARFDPFGPPGIPGFNPDTFIHGRPSRPNPPTHPDLENFRYD